MVLGFETILWYLLLLDCIGANISAWFFPDWYKKKFKKFHKIAPLTKMWCGLYLVLVLWVGYSLSRLGLL